MSELTSICSQHTLNDLHKNFEERKDRPMNWLDLADNYKIDFVKREADAEPWLREVFKKHGLPSGLLSK